MTQHNNIEKSSGNIFADLAFDNAEQELVKARLASKIVSIVKRRRWKQKETAKTLGLTQSKVSLLVNGQLQHFSIDKLMRLLSLLNQDIDIVVRAPKRRKAGRIKVIYATG